MYDVNNLLLLRGALNQSLAKLCRQFVGNLNAEDDVFGICFVLPLCDALRTTNWELMMIEIKSLNLLTV